MFDLILISLIAFICQVQAGFNLEPQSVTLGQTNSSGQIVAISPSELKIAVGFSDGTLKIFDTQLNQLCEIPPNNNSKLIDMTWLPSFGLVTLDSFNTMTLWQDSCQVINKIQFNKTASGIIQNEIMDNNTVIGTVAVNFGDRIQVYDSKTSQLILQHTIPENQTCLSMVYNLDQEKDKEKRKKEKKVIVLLASTNASKIRKYDTKNGTQIASFDVESPVILMDTIQVFTGDMVIAMTVNNQILRFDSKGQVLNRGIFPESVSLAICPTTNEFILTHFTQSIGIYLYAGNLQQIITSFADFAQDIDCSSSYLVSVDASGYVYVFTYKEFQSWIVVIISSVLGGLFLLVIGVIVFIKVRAKWAEEVINTKYSGGKSAKYHLKCQR